MKKVVLLLRVSTNFQNYEYQRNTLTDICKRNGWEVVHTVENKVSGAKKSEEREEIVELLDYVKNKSAEPPQRVRVPLSAQSPRDSAAERSAGEAGIPLKIKYISIPATP